MYIYDTQSVKVSPEQDHLQVLGMDGVSVDFLSSTWAGAQPGLIIGELQCLVSLETDRVDRILSCCHVPF